MEKTVLIESNSHTVRFTVLKKYSVVFSMASLTFGVKMFRKKFAKWNLGTSMVAIC